VKAKHPLFEDPLLYAQSKANEDIKDAKDHLERLNQFLYHLQEVTYPEPLFVSYQSLQEHLQGLTHSGWYLKMAELQYRQVIKIIKTGAFRKGASEYVYLNHPCWTQDEESRAALERLLASAEDGSDLNMGLLTAASLRSFFTRAA
jgi:hypothetical protein